jgi:YVTN family beta-propeller protein
MTPDSGVTGQDGGRGFVVSSEVTISPESAGTLERSFRERLHLVEKAPGFRGRRPRAIAITPDGQTAYVANLESASVTPIRTATSTPGPAIKVGNQPIAIAIT